MKSGTYMKYMQECRGKTEQTDRLKSESKGATNYTPTCVVSANDPQTNALW